MIPPPTDSDLLAAFIADEALPADFAAQVGVLHAPLADEIARAAAARDGVLVVGVCGPQGSGKSTTVGLVARLLAARGLKAAVLSLDDVYLPVEARIRLAAEVHPLLRTRGVPGTHDVALCLATLDALARPGLTAIPRFDKAADTRRPKSQWDRFGGPADVVLFEGWCVGARPQVAADLAAPVNALERDADPDGVWRRHVNAALAGPYQTLFGRLDQLVMLQAPSFEVVAGWRTEQEHKLRARLARQGDHRGLTMNDAQVAAFVQHYERLTRWIAAEMPQRADMLVRLDQARRGELDRAEIAQ